jgi:sporulation protein YlmC with PRC-barrel domain
MDIPINAKIQCTDGSCGRSTHVVLNPVSNTVTHLVVKEPGFAHPERIVSIDKIISSTPSEIRLRCSKAELEATDHFLEYEYLPVGKATGGAYQAEEELMFPYVLPILEPEGEYVALEHEQVPPHELAVQRGANVEATDGYVGRVDAFLVAPENGHISHLILREGHLWGQKDITIPITAIRHIEEDTVYLKLNKAAIEALPAIPVRDWWA